MKRRRDYPNPRHEPVHVYRDGDGNIRMKMISSGLFWAGTVHVHDVESIVSDYGMRVVTVTGADLNAAVDRGIRNWQTRKRAIDHPDVAAAVAELLAKQERGEL